MYGEIWFITQRKNDKDYYFVGRENRGRRTWSTAFKNAATFPNKDRAIQHWEEFANSEGAVTGWNGYGR